MEDLKKIRSFFSDNVIDVSKKQIILIMVLTVVSVSFNVLLPIITRNIVDQGLIKKAAYTVLHWCIIFTCVFLIQVIVDFIREKIRIDIYLKLKKELIDSTLQHLWKADYSFFLNKKMAQVVYDMNYDSETIASLFDNEMLFGFTQVFNIIAGCIGLGLINWKMMLGILCLFPIKVLIVNYFSKVNKKYTTKFIESSDNNIRFEEDTLDGVRELKIYGLYDKFKMLFRKNIEDVFLYEKFLNLLPQINAGLDNMLAQLCVVFIYLIGAVNIANDRMTVGSIAAFVTYSSYVLGPISVLLNIRYKISGIIPSIDRINEVNNIGIESDEVCIQSEITSRVIDKQGNIYIKDLKFSYDGHNNILNNITATISPNTITAIVGRNGAGKTTLINILLRLLKPGNGNICIGDKSIYDIPLNTYRSKIAYVSQNAFLFCDSIKDNVTLYGDISNKDIVKVCKECGMSDILKEYPLDYNVGNNGIRLSGGQRQKVTLARAILSRRKYLIFDEVTSNMDVESKKNYCDLMIKYRKGRTIIIVTHDQDVIDIADNIVKL